MPSSPTSAGTTASEIGRKTPEAAPAAVASATTAAGSWTTARKAKQHMLARSEATSERRGESRFSRSPKARPMTSGGRNSATNTADTQAARPVSW